MTKQQDKASKLDDLYRIISATRWSNNLSCSNNEKPEFIAELQDAKKRYTAAVREVNKILK